MSRGASLSPGWSGKMCVKGEYAGWRLKTLFHQFYSQVSLFRTVFDVGQAGQVLDVVAELSHQNPGE